MTSQTQTATSEVPPHVAMLQMISGFWISRAICVVAQLGIPDQLKHSPRSVADLAAATNTHSPSLYRVLRALVSVGVFAETDADHFALTPLSETLLTGVPGSIRSFAISELGGEHYDAWGNLMQSVKTGEIAFDHVFGMDVWEFFRKNPENARIFNDSMSGMTAAMNESILSRYDFSGIRKLVDVGGGHGGLITSIIQAYPEMTGVLFDAPSVIEGARSRIATAGLADRCETFSGDFFQSVPAGGDGYILKWIIHDWNDERAETILKNCRNAISRDGRLMLVDVVIPPGREPHFGKFIDLNMLVMAGGLERTEAEFRRLLEATGFRLVRVVNTDSPISIVEAAPA
ncbi:MAG: acetylserotonin O-methyltransferase [Pyrinomonadaceae bacterium]|nr:acetylserotonin O-methyltransferase [Pyrinomonadaceae bacterium]